jgi:triosephosphate isomerase
MRKKIVAGNWKMNLLPEEALELYTRIVADCRSEDCEVLVFPPALYVRELIGQQGVVPVGVQNFYPSEKGAFTGEISIAQVVACGVKHALIGHSERRIIFGESNEFLKEKINAALAHAVTPIVCCGESLAHRDAGTHLDFVCSQLLETIGHLSAEELGCCIVAYEPIWAIGTGRTATSEQAQEMHKHIRTWIATHFGKESAETLSILYGGSCNDSNASELFACPDLDGGLIGGASLDAASFLKIARAF